MFDACFEHAELSDWKRPAGAVRFRFFSFTGGRSPARGNVAFRERFVAREGMRRVNLGRDDGARAASP